MRNIYCTVFVLGWPEQPSRIKVPYTGTTSLINQPRNDTTTKTTLSFVLYESSFATFSRGHPVNMQRVFSFGKWKEMWKGLMTKLANSSTSYLFCENWLTDMEVMESALVIYVYTCLRIAFLQVGLSSRILNVIFLAGRGGFSIFLKRRPLRWKSWKYNFVGVSGHNIEIDKTWGFYLLADLFSLLTRLLCRFLHFA